MQRSADLKNRRAGRGRSGSSLAAAVLVTALLAILAHLSCGEPEAETTRVTVRLLGAPGEGDAVRVSFTLDGQPDKRSPYLFNRTVSFPSVRTMSSSYVSRRELIR
jgi:hypothetical protein